MYVRNRKNHKKILGLSVLSLVVVIVLIGASFAMVTGNLSQNSISRNPYSLFGNGNSPGNYTVTINERGLPAGYLWNVTYGGADSSGVFFNGAKNSTITSIHLSLANGNYSFTAASAGYVSNYTLQHYSQPEPVVVAGSNLTYSIFFNKTGSSENIVAWI